jgi:hypothetical protein
MTGALKKDSHGQFWKRRHFMMILFDYMADKPLLRMSPRACILHTSSSAPPRGFSLPTKFIFDQLPGIVITYCCFGCTRSVDSPGHCFARPPSLRQAVKRVEDGIGGNGLAWMQVGCRWVDSPSEGVLWTDFASLVDQRQAVKRVRFVFTW